MLTLPAAALAPAGQAAEASDRAHSQYTVVKGDTLSEIAQQHLDDAEAWPRIFEASRGIPQPDGRRLTDPDLILPGWHLLIPSAADHDARAPNRLGTRTSRVDIRDSPSAGRLGYARERHTDSGGGRDVACNRRGRPCSRRSVQRAGGAITILLDDRGFGHE